MPNQVIIQMISEVSSQMKKPMKVIGLFSVLTFFGCSTIQKNPVVTQTYSDKQALESYGRVLKNFVNAKGQVDFEAMKASPKDLEIYVEYVGRKSWNEFKTPAELLAHHLNSYNALSMYTVISRGIPKTNAGLNKVGFFFLTKMQIGGKQMALVDYENKSIRTLGEDRIHWALNCMSVSCPRLPQTPFTAANLEKELQNGATEFFNSETHVKVDDAKKIVYVSEILDFFPEDFVPKKAQSISAYVNLYRKTLVPLDYKVKFIPYDWTINNSNHR